MSVGFIILCHNALDRVAQTARHLAEQGAPVIIHVDRAVSRKKYTVLRDSLSDLSDVRFCARYRCDWGGWRLVQATLVASKLMLREFPHVGHVYLASGACIPLRPVADLVTFLKAHPATDFIESVSAGAGNWVVTGLESERFKFYFPFSWQKRRWLFDAHVWLQRRLGISRRMPLSLSPHLGSQWWCLTRKTLGAIVDHPDRSTLERFFKKCWIPDEGYFQTLVRHVSFRVESRSLTYARFDANGKPHVLYDDHLDLLRQSGAFMARKVWPRAEAIYDFFVTKNGISRVSLGETSPLLDLRFATARRQRQFGRSGLIMQSRFPLTKRRVIETANPYFVTCGFDDVFEQFPQWLAQDTVLSVHGHLFAPEGAEFAGGQELYKGAISSVARLRDHHTANFLSNLIWNARDRFHAFQFSPRDNQNVAAQLAIDLNAHVHLIADAWSYALFKANLPLEKALQYAEVLHERELAFMAALTSGSAFAQLTITPLAEVLADAPRIIAGLTADIGAVTQKQRVGAMPQIIIRDGFDLFNQQLRSAGIGVEPIDNAGWMTRKQPFSRR